MTLNQVSSFFTDLPPGAYNFIHEVEAYTLAIRNKRCINNTRTGIKKAV